MQRQAANRKGEGLLSTPFPICERCNQEDDTMEKRTEKTVFPIQKLCEECNEKPLINPVSKYCPSCLGRRAHLLKGRKKEPKQAKEKNVTMFNLKGNDTTLTIDFGKYAPLLRDVEKLAEEEMRPVEMQIIYILKKPSSRFFPLLSFA